MQPNRVRALHTCDADSMKNWQRPASAPQFVNLKRAKLGVTSGVVCEALHHALLYRGQRQPSSADTTSVEPSQRTAQIAASVIDKQLHARIDRLSCNRAPAIVRVTRRRRHLNGHTNWHLAGLLLQQQASTSLLLTGVFRTGRQASIIRIIPSSEVVRTSALAFSHCDRSSTKKHWSTLHGTKTGRIKGTPKMIMVDA